METKCILQKYELNGCIAAKKLELTKKHLKARLRWLKRYELRNAGAWNKIIFSNETRMELDSKTKKLLEGFQESKMIHVTLQKQ